MFGSTSNFSWQNPQQNQQQQQQTGAFGQPAGGFGTAFGSTGTGAFVQNQPAQQPQANPMFGGLGTTTTNAGTSGGFGTFGSSNTSQSNGANPIFGGTKPSTGFGAFGGGGGGAFGGGGGAFGQSTNTASSSGTTGLFGQAPSTAAPGAFGTSNSIFGGKTTTFGANTAGGTVPPVTTGSSNPPYTVHTEKDVTSGNTVFHYQAISCMPSYANTSHEELRLQDYAQGRKTASTFGPGAFGSTQPASTGIFGAQPPQQNPQPPTFGGTTGNTSFGTFGATNPTGTAPASTGAFGATFGSNPQQQQQQQQQPQTQGFGNFGSTSQQPQQQQSGGIFGSGAFGSTANKPAFSGFGNTTNTALGGTFGQQNQQQQQQQAQPSLFGGNTAAPASTGFGTFGGTANKSLFGGNSTSTTQPTAFGSFGSTQPQQNQQPQNQQNSLFGAGLFGNNQQQQQSQGNQQPAANTALGSQTSGTGTGLFGGGSLFGNNQQQQQQQQQTQQPQTGAFGSLFAPKPPQPASNVFGGGFGQQSTNNAQQPSIFGNPLGQTNNQSMLGGSLFGNKPATPAIGASATPGNNLFGATPNQAGGLFNVTANAPGAQGTLTASISQPIGADLPIFDLLPPGPRLVNLDSSQQQKKKAGFFVDMPTRSSVPRFGYTPANSRLRGFSTSSAAGPTNSTANPFSVSSTLTSSRVEPFSLSRTNDKSTGVDAILGRSSSPSLGSGQRQSVKKVILDKKVEPSELFVRTGGSPGLRGGKVVFSPKLSVASREKDALGALAAPNGVTDSPTPPARSQRTPNRFTAQSVPQPADSEGQNTADLEEGDYWVKPDLTTLKRAGYDELSSFKGLVVGRVGYGEIEFLEPVDLTGLPKLGALLGDVIRFEEKECSVYPESDEVDKPPPGSGLNVPARLTLFNCWAVDKSTREPIRDESHPSAVKHLKRLKKIPNTHFESFTMDDGRWTFKVEHF